MDRLRRCKCKINVYENNAWKTVEHEGWFHQWGMSYEEFDNGPGNYSIAIVELDNGHVILPMADDIIFLDKPDSKGTDDKLSDESD